MDIFKSGVISNLLMLIITFAVMLIHFYYAQRGKKWAYEMRPMEQAQAISDGIDRAVEEAKPVHISPGDMGILSGPYAIQTLAGMNIYKYTLRMCVEKGAQPIIIVPINPECLPLMDGIYRETTLQLNKPDAYDRDNLNYFGNTFQNINIGWSARILRDGGALLVNAGANSGTSNFTVLGWARNLGTTVVGGTARYHKQGTWAVFADYPFFMEDLYAAGAYVTGDPIVQSTQVSTDPIKFGLMAVLVIAAVLSLLGISASDWLRI
jgi:hypothetical protein